MAGAGWIPWWVATVLLLTGCGAGTAIETSSRVSTSSPTPPSSPAASGFSCDPHAGGVPGTMAQLTDVQAAHHDGYDELTFQFVAPVTGAALQTTPAYSVTPQSSADFTRDAIGGQVTLEGAAGLRVVMQGSSGFDNLAATPMQTYTGSTDVHVQLPEVRELAQTGDFERVLSWGVGLRTGACYRVRELTDPARLVIDVSTG